jgi:hypothetical protein
MGRICAACITIDAKLDSTLVKKILAYGSTLGFKYYFDIAIGSSVKRAYLSIDQAADNIIDELIDSEHDIFGQSGKVSFGFQENDPIIRFCNYTPDQTSIRLLTVGYPWCKKKPDEKKGTPDWDLYITLLLQLCKDFAILEISTDDEYFNYC